MPQDVFDNGRYITKADANTPIRFQVLIDLLGEDINTRSQMLERQPVHVRCFNGSTDLVVFNQLKITVWIRLITLEESEQAPDRHRAKHVLRKLARKKNESIVYAAARLVRSFRAQDASHTYHHAIERIFSWKYTEAPDLRNLCECFEHMTTPTSADRIAIPHDHDHPCQD